MSAVASWGHCDTKTHGRSGNRSGVAAIAYRFAEVFHDERLDITHDYTRKQGVMDKFIVAPEDVPEWVYDAERLWNGAEAAEKRSNSVIYRETILALPAYLSSEERSAIARDFAEAISGRYGVAVSVAIHAPGKDGDHRNFHAHLMFTTREIMPEGFGKKTRILDNRYTTGPEEFKKIQAMGQGIMNRYLEAAGADERVDFRSFDERGVDQEPTTHLGPTATEIERRGDESERGNVNREIEKRNAEREAQKSELASVDSAIIQREQELTLPATSPEDARQRLQGDKQLYTQAMSAAERFEKALPADRMGWRERMLLYVARTAKSMFDSIAEKALALIRLKHPKPQREQRKEPTAHDQRWQKQEQARRQAEKNRGMEL